MRNINLGQITLHGLKVVTEVCNIWYKTEVPYLWILSWIIFFWNAHKLNASDVFVAQGVFKQTSKLHYSLDLGLMRLVMAFCMLQECIVTNNTYKLSTNPINSLFWTWIIATIILPLQEVAPHGEHFLEPCFAPNVHGAYDISAKISRYWPCIYDQVFGCQKNVSSPS